MSCPKDSQLKQPGSGQGLPSSRAHVLSRGSQIQSVQITCKAPGTSGCRVPASAVTDSADPGGRAWECLFLMSPQVMPMLLARGPHFENHYSADLSEMVRIGISVAVSPFI